MANEPDNIVRMMRQHLKNLDKMERDLIREKDRTKKALALFAPEESRIGGDVKIGRVSRISQGPIRRDSHAVMWNAIKANFAPDFEMPYGKLEEIGVEAGLRPGQANGAVTTLYRMGRLERTRKGHYKYHNGKGKEVTDDVG